ncbi:PRAME family member 12-like [Octodon degus]|uniref:PRAME family member 12-like n=1 Tax=Octodon degus TaxID=10160 RepID=A0A6P3FY66_OCTDE|nr:PRAME family member 12-like [Octodon degus]
MSTQSPCALLELSIESLLRDEALAKDAVEDLPRELFPPVFMEAFTKGLIEVLKVMVLSWPFPSLPLGALMTMSKPGTVDTHKDAMRVQKRILKAVLYGLDVLLSQKVYSRRLKLQVLDMQDKQNFWRTWAGNQVEACSSEAMEMRKTGKSGTRETNQKTLKVILDLWINQDVVCPLTSYLLKWVHDRGDLVQLEYKRLYVTSMCIHCVTDQLQMVNFESVLEVEVGYCWTLFDLADFATYLRQMRNLYKLTLSDISEPAFTSRVRRDQLITQITSQFLKLHCLQEIYMVSVSFLKDHLDQVLRCLPTPLETLSVTHSQLSHSDWNQLPCSEQTRQLKHFELCCISLTNFSPEPLQILLDNVAATLTTLHLENCGITDAQVCAFLPSLSCCSQLTALCFVGNFMSVGTMKNLLSHTARMSNLTLELYSPPQEVHVPRNGDLQQIQEPLRRMMRTLNYPRTVWFCVHQESGHNHPVYNLRPSPCPTCILI